MNGLFRFIAAGVMILSIAVVYQTQILRQTPDEESSHTYDPISNSIDTPLLAYKMSIGQFPTTEQGFQALLTAPPGVTNWHGPYLFEAPKDHWGHPYHYRSPGLHNPKSYDVWSSGPDGKDGTPDDIGNW
jgi:general secretion pathway protein G